MFLIPTGSVKFITLPVMLNDENQLTFDDFNHQFLFFNSHVEEEIERVNFVRENKGKGIIKVNGIYTDYLNYNYMMFQNTSFNSKWFFCYIHSVKYINENVTEIEFSLDLWQTFQFQIRILPCYIDRGHTATDNLFQNTVPEGLETGEYIYGTEQNVDMDELGYIIGLSDYSGSHLGGIFGNIYSGVAYRYYSSGKALSEFIKEVNDKGKADAITTIYTVPKFVMVACVDGEYLVGNVTTGEKDVHYTLPIRDIDGYIPKNKKLYCYPYNFITVSNNKGNKANYRLEMFRNARNPSENTYHFKLQGSITANSTCALIPQDYKNIKNNLDEKITLDGYPLCSWNNDIYANWLAQNQNTLKATKNCAIVDGVQSLINKNIGGVVGTFEKIYQQNASIQDKATLPNHAEGNINDGNFNVANKLQHFTIRHCVITKEYAEKIDDFFTMYGYKINKVEIPNIKSRKNHNYIKTIGCHITGVDQEIYAKAIEQMFDNGITFWHNTQNFGNYNVDNSPK